MSHEFCVRGADCGDKNKGPLAASARDLRKGDAEHFGIDLDEQVALHASTGEKPRLCDRCRRQVPSQGKKGRKPTQPTPSTEAATHMSLSTPNPVPTAIAFTSLSRP